MVRIAYSDKPFACSVVIAGGGNGQFLAGGDDVDDGPAVVGEGLDERRVQVAGLLDATAGLTRSVPNVTIPAAFISNSTKFSDEC